MLHQSGVVGGIESNRSHPFIFFKEATQNGFALTQQLESGFALLILQTVLNIVIKLAGKVECLAIFFLFFSYFRKQFLFLTVLLLIKHPSIFFYSFHSIQGQGLSLSQLPLAKGLGGLDGFPVHHQKAYTAIASCSLLYIHCTSSAENCHVLTHSHIKQSRYGGIAVTECLI